MSVTPSAPRPAGPSPNTPSDGSSRRPSPVIAVTIGALGLLLVMGLVLALSRMDRGSDPDLETAATPIGHIHGIGIDPADGRLYIGAHLGVFGVSPDGVVEPVGEQRHDTMGFTVAGPNRFLASGHPDLTSDGPPHLGLIESDDAAETWTTLSLEGEADFHALEAVKGRIWGADSLNARLVTSVDGRRWEPVAEGQFGDVAVNPADPGRALATDQTGRLRAYDSDGGEQDLPAAPVLIYLDWVGPDQVVGLAPDGTAHLSRDRGATWQAAGTVPGQPSALEADDRGWYAASDTGLYVSTDSGDTWTPLLQYSDAP